MASSLTGLARVSFEDVIGFQMIHKTLLWMLDTTYYGESIYSWTILYDFYWRIRNPIILKAPLHTRFLKRIRKEFCILPVFLLSSPLILRVFRKKIIWEFRKNVLGVSQFYCFEFFLMVHKIKSIWFYEPSWRIRNNRMTSKAFELKNVNKKSLHFLFSLWAPLFY